MIWIATLLLSLMSVTVYTGKIDSDVIIRPTDSSPAMCGSYGHYALCDTLSNILSNHSSILNNCTLSEYKFMPGIHKLKARNGYSAIFQGVRNLTWYGHKIKLTTIFCESKLAFVFVGIVKLQLQYLQFSNCGQMLPINIVSSNIFSYQFAKASTAESIAASVSVVDVHFLLLMNIEIRESLGYGLLLVNIQKSSTLLSSSFLENNHQQYSEYSFTVGGNIMMIFNSHSHNLETVNVLINDTLIQGGRDPSGMGIRQCHRYNPRLPFPFQANGLAIVNLLHESLFIVISNSSFVDNTGTNNHPSVLVHEDSNVRNLYIFEDNYFEADGTFRINLETSNFSSHSIDNTHQVIINRCSFIHGFVDGLLICAYPQYPILHHVSIQNCAFRGYKKNYKVFRSSALKVIIGSERESSKTCPKFKLIVNSSIFHSNEITAIASLLNPFSYVSQMISGCLPVVINNCTYINNTLFNTSIILIITQGKLKFHLWMYPNSSNAKGAKLEQTKITNSFFLNNYPGTFTKLGTVNIERTYVTIENCSFQKSFGTAVHIDSSVVILSGRNIISNNTGQKGGGLALIKSIVYLSLNSVTLIEYNEADFGGGIYAIPISVNKKINPGLDTPLNLCPFDIPKINGSSNNTGIALLQNSATYSGNSIYGALYSKCHRAENCKLLSKQRVSCSYKSLAYSRHFSPFFKIDWQKENEVSSVPNKLCICSAGQPTSQCSSTNVAAFPGQSFTVPMSAVGQFNSTSRAVIKSTVCTDYSRDSSCLPDHFADFDSGEAIQILQHCQNVTFTVMSSKRKVRNRVKLDRLSLDAKLRNNIKLQNMRIKVTLRSCPVGFTLVNRNSKTSFCSCKEYIVNHPSIDCDERKGLVIVSGKIWIGFYKLHSENVSIHNGCPYDYCLQGKKNINLSEPDEQCSHNRRGVLCGACQSNLSVVLGTSNCKECSNVYLLLFIPFALAGVALVVLLLKCNLTVSVGHINGIIFYANIVHVNKSLFFPERNIPYQIFSTFIAWLNLDLGIETCFFENMDTYAKVWLQFVFPVYLWIMVAIIVIVSHYSSLMGKLIGNNSVPVLATLFLLSYAKLLRTIIAAVSFTFITSKNGLFYTVWLRDGNVEYFSLRHIPLFLAALAFFFIFILPLMLLVLLAPCLQARSHHKPFRWVNRLKPFLDAYQGPYSNKFRYWTGLLLIFRILLLVIYASNYENDPSMTFFWTIIIVGPTGIICAKEAVYRYRFTNFIETLSLLNTALLCSVCWLTTTTGYGKWHPIREYAVYISVTIMMIAFLAIVLYQAYIPKRKKKQKKLNRQELEAATEVNLNEAQAPTYSVVELNEPLLDTN